MWKARCARCRKQLAILDGTYHSTSFQPNMHASPCRHVFIEEEQVCRAAFPSTDFVVLESTVHIAK